MIEPTVSLALTLESNPGVYACLLGSGVSATSGIPTGWGIVVDLIERVARTLIVNTHKTDLHGRYVAHIFYAFSNQGIERTFLKGRYLNQELIDKGFARVV
jgi:hypothetical protein